MTRHAGLPSAPPGATGATDVVDFVQLAGSVDGAGFECSSTVGGVSGGLCLTEDALVLRGGGASTRVGTRDIRSWQATPTGATFSLAVEARARHTVVLLAQFQAATVQAMTRAAGPASSPVR
ncbi:hypothetical protein [Rathayibacter tanaceti]|uniref:Uncharacterized protein n=2 Tax=Rathayibacter tanaceti TaxID=1671680 RepID=A0A166D5X8_9MICO|nr:hypothetical protein [Rathayibacter tanaceti]KZX21827.1 hypothetical protein ACH61_01039 [Rathayibacter tanaceti]QHC56734.1 hypothetical protein GSU10_14595 [Rathayibacter tanaceti]TCO32972.1 hypothetical protein EV639_11514 [Rathayibacter tanaceti]